MQMINNTTRFALMLTACAVTTAAAYAGPRPPALTDALLDAIRHVESGGDDGHHHGGGEEAHDQAGVATQRRAERCYVNCV